MLMLSFTISVSAFGIDDAFSYKYNQKLGNCGEDGLAISCEFGTCHVVPVSLCPQDMLLFNSALYK
jgi:actin-related protein 5